MAPKEPNRHQLSARLSYQQQTPRFLQKLQNKYSGRQEDSEEESDPEFEPDDGSGRPPIPRRPRERPAIPVRPDDDPGSADEDDGDEKPVVVVLKAGKHLTEREAENIRRKERGLPPLEDKEGSPTDVEPSKEPSPSKTNTKPKENYSLSFSTKASAPSLDHLKNLKRKAVGQPEPGESNSSRSGPKKKKKEKKTLLSFGDDT